VLAYLDGRQFAFAEVIVVDDGSTDGTAALVENWKHSALRLVRNPGNRGKGFAVRNGMLNAQGEWILCTDADLSSPIEELKKLTDAVERSGARIAIGSRAVDRSLVSVHQSAAREIAGRFFNLAMRLVTGLPYQDTQCGFKLYEGSAAKEIFKRQRLDTFGFDVEDLFIAKLLGIRGVEVPVRWANVEGTKVSMVNGLNAFLDPLRVRWNQIKGEYR
jgi:glycosyltransferase involved in cell wall biosynthesis